MIASIQYRKLIKEYFYLNKSEILTERLSFIIITLLSLICFFLAFSIPDSLFGGKTILTEANDWSGVQRLENGFMILPQAPNPSIAQVNLPVKANTNYKIEVESRCDSKVNFFIDFHGPNYDSGDQETMFECGVTNEHHLINSGSPPADVAARIFFLSEHTSISILKIKITKLSKYSNYLKIAVMSAPLFLVSLLFLYTKKSRLAVATFLALGISLIYTQYAVVPQSGNSSDSLWYIPTAQSILRDGDIDLSEYRQKSVNAWDYRIVFSDKYGAINLFPIGPSLISLPIVFLENFVDRSDLDIAADVANLVSVLSVVLIFWLAGNLGCSIPVSLTISIIFALATSQFSIHAGALWSHNVTVFTSLLALVIATNKNGRYFIVLPFVLFLGYLSRPDFSLFVIGILFYLYFSKRENAIQVAIILAILMAMLIAWSYNGFEAPLPPYYRSTRLSVSGFWDHLSGQLFSPSRGLFIFNPIFLLSVLGSVIAWSRRLEFGLLYRTISVVCLTFLVAVACFSHWWGGYSFGPRLHAAILGLLTVLMIPVFHQLPTYRTARIPIMIFIAVAFVWGAAVHGHGVRSHNVNHWNASPSDVDRHPERLWDWTDPQFLR